MQTINHNSTKLVQSKKIKLKRIMEEFDNLEDKDIRRLISSCAEYLNNENSGHYGEKNENGEYLIRSIYGALLRVKSTPGFRYSLKVKDIAKKIILSISSNGGNLGSYSKNDVLFCLFIYNQRA